MLVVNPADESLKRSQSDDLKIDRSFSPNFTKIDGGLSYCKNTLAIKPNNLNY
jgi:hypothetical protein